MNFPLVLIIRIEVVILQLLSWLLVDHLHDTLHSHTTL